MWSIDHMLSRIARLIQHHYDGCWILQFVYLAFFKLACHWYDEEEAVPKRMHGHLPMQCIVSAWSQHPIDLLSLYVPSTSPPILKGKLYIITEYAGNGNLHDYIKKQKSRIHEDLIWKLFTQASLGCH